MATNEVDTATYTDQDVIEAVDDGSSTGDESSIFTDTTSINSSILDYQYENGRRYHNFRAGAYLLPNDEQEQERLDMGHHCWNFASRKVVFGAVAS